MYSKPQRFRLKNIYQNLELGFFFLEERRFTVKSNNFTSKKKFYIIRKFEKSHRHLKKKIPLSWWSNFIMQGMNHHFEHHDHPRIPCKHLPKLRALYPLFFGKSLYDCQFSHVSNLLFLVTIYYVFCVVTYSFFAIYSRNIQ